MAANTRTLITLVAGLGAVVVLASGASASAPARPVVRPSTRRPSRARSSSSSAPAGEVTLGPITQVITNPKTGKITRTTDPSSLTAAEKAKYVQEAARTKSLDDSDYALLTPEQAEALESASVEAARAGLPGANTMQQELARRAAIKARESMGKKAAPPFPKTPSNPTVAREPQPSRDDAPRAYISPPTPINLELARREAPALAKHIRTKKFNYSRQSLRDFQTHAGLTIDGIYGPLSVSALEYFGVVSPPKALFKAKPGTVTIYAPAT